MSHLTMPHVIRLDFHCIYLSSMKQISIKHINNLHNDAIRGLDFYRDELTILNERLGEIAAANTNREVAEQVEHFQNQFIIHNEQIDELQHALRENLQLVAKQVIQTGGQTNETSLPANEGLYEKYLTEEKMLNELRHDFNRFASKWL
jgi:hypothetical protein